MHFEAGDSEAMAFEQKAHYQAETADWVEKLEDLSMCHYAHIPEAWMNYILKVLVKHQPLQEQNKELAEERLHSLQMHPQEDHEKHFQPMVDENFHWGGSHQFPVLQVLVDMLRLMKTSLKMAMSAYVETPVKAVAVKVVVEVAY